MTIYGWLIFVLWFSLVAYWAVSAARVKRSSGGGWIWWREIALRLAFFALVLLALRVAVVGRLLPNALPYLFNTRALTGLIGFVFCLLGVGLAILGRACLEHNRRTELSGEQNPGLVTNGPYAFVRHPIASGMLLAMLGSAIGQSILWLLPLIVYGPHFILCARREERLLIEQFPQRYRAYMQRTKMLLPFVL
jgi:protein-S-isoprenylcysteine O-methyltransferase Ste14